MASDLSERPTSRNADSKQARQQLHLLLPGLERPNMWRSKGLAGFHPVLLSGPFKKLLSDLFALSILHMVTKHRLPLSTRSNFIISVLWVTV